MDIEYIKLKNTWGKDVPDLEVYLDGGWKENGKADEKKMVRLHDPAEQMMTNLAVVDSFADPESKSICYYIDLNKSQSTDDVHIDVDLGTPRSRKPSHRRPSVFVGNIPWAATEYELRNLFAGSGQVKRFRIVVDRKTKRSRGISICVNRV